MKPAWLAALATVVCIVLHAVPASAAAVAPAGALSKAAVVELLVIQLANTRASSDARLSSEQRAAAYRLADAETRLTREIRLHATASARAESRAVEMAALNADLRAVRAQMRALAEAAAAGDPALAEELAAYREVMAESLATAAPEKLAAWARFAEGDREGAFPVLVELSRAENLARTRAADRLAAKVRSETAKRNAANLRPVAMGALTMILDHQLPIQGGIDLWLEIIGEGPGRRADHVFLSKLYLVDANDRLAREHIRKAAAMQTDPEGMAADPPEAVLAESLMALAADESASMSKYFQIIASALTPADGAAKIALSRFQKIVECTEERNPLSYRAGLDGTDPKVCGEADRAILAALEVPETEAEERNLLLRGAVLLAQASIPKPVLCFRNLDKVCEPNRQVIARASFDATLAICLRVSRTDPVDRRWVCGKAFLVASMRALNRQAALTAAAAGLALVEGAPLPGRRSEDMVAFLNTAASSYSLMDEKVLASRTSARAMEAQRRIASAPGALGRDDVELARVIATHGDYLEQVDGVEALKGFEALVAEVLQIRRRRPNAIGPCYALDDLANDLVDLLKKSVGPVSLGLLERLREDAKSCEGLAVALEEKYLRDSAAVFRQHYAYLGGARMSRKDYAGARAYFEKAIARDASGEPIEAPDVFGHRTLRNLKLLAINQEELKDLPAARDTYEDIVRLARAPWAPPTPLAELIGALKDSPPVVSEQDIGLTSEALAAAAKTATKAAASWREALGPPTDGPFAIDLLILSDLNGKLGRPAEAERGYLEIVEQATLDSWMADDAAAWLSDHYAKANEHRRALPFLERRVAYMTRQLDVLHDPAAPPYALGRAKLSKPRPSSLTWRYFWLSFAQLRLGDTTAFNTSLENVFATARSERVPPAEREADAPDLAKALMLMGHVLAEQPGREPDARALYTRSLEITGGLPAGKARTDLTAGLKDALTKLSPQRP